MMHSFAGLLAEMASAAAQHAEPAAAAHAGPGAAQHFGFTPTDIYLLLSVPLLPLVGYVLQIAIGRKLPRKGDWLLTSLMFCGLGISLYEFAKCLGVWSPEFAVSSKKMGLEWPWLSSTPGQPNVVAGILYDNLSAAMLV